MINSSTRMFQGQLVLGVGLTSLFSFGCMSPGQPGMPPGMNPGTGTITIQLPPPGQVSPGQFNPGQVPGVTPPPLFVPGKGVVPGQTPYPGQTSYPGTQVPFDPSGTPSLTGATAPAPTSLAPVPATVTPAGTVPATSLTGTTPAPVPGPNTAGVLPNPSNVPTSSTAIPTSPGSTVSPAPAITSPTAGATANVSATAPQYRFNAEQIAALKARLEELSGKSYTDQLKRIVDSKAQGYTADQRYAWLINLAQSIRARMAQDFAAEIASLKSYIAPYSTDQGAEVTKIMSDINALTPQAIRGALEQAHGQVTGELQKVATEQAQAQTTAQPQVTPSLDMINQGNDVLGVGF